GDLSSSGLICPLLRSGLRRVALGVASFFQVRNGFITQGLCCTSKRWQLNAKLVGSVFNFLRQAGNKLRCSRINLALRLGRQLLSWVFLGVSGGGATEGQSASERNCSKTSRNAHGHHHAISTPP